METVDVRGSEKHWSTEAAERATPTVREDDFANMRRMGKEQQFRRNFNAVTITSFCVAAMMGFVFIPINFSVLIELAGTGGTIVIYLANFAGNFFVVASLAEMSSM
ncbi:MAG: hypothetical protein M1821_007325 [Bathelium mastoideum]|nr:MAG: hypothetical protein M1821_007325 [Bathelium mastoideum]